jgi:hypothetical protein
MELICGVSFLCLIVLIMWRSHSLYGLLQRVFGEEESFFGDKIDDERGETTLWVAYK